MNTAAPTPGNAQNSPAQATGPYDQFILFGDSLMEFSANPALGFAFMPALQHEYMRRLDVINRGFAGYTTAHAIRILPKFMPTPEQSKVRILLIFFGANDACLPGTPQHVPLDEYKANLKAMAQHPKVKAHKPTRVLLALLRLDAQLNTPKKYAHAVKQLGEELSLPVVDIWNVMITEARWNPGEPLPGSKRVPENPYLQKHFLDGLHFSGPGYRVLFREVNKAVATAFPRQTPAAIKSVFPPWPEAPR